MVAIKQAVIILKLINARTIHTCFEKLCLRVLVIKTVNPIHKNQIEKKIDNFPRTMVVTVSCISPQKMKVNSRERETGRNSFNGLKMNFPR